MLPHPLHHTASRALTRLFTPTTLVLRFAIRFASGLRSARIPGCIPARKPFLPQVAGTLRRRGMTYRAGWWSVGNAGVFDQRAMAYVEEPGLPDVKDLACDCYFRVGAVR